MVRRDTFQEAVRRLSGEGYKILLDLLASCQCRLRYAEVPYAFRNRFAGSSKVDSAVVMEYLLLIIDKMIGHLIPARFVMFSMVGFSGIVVHFAGLWTAYRFLVLDFAIAQAVATLVAMTSNYTLNNVFTYRDRRRRGARFFTGLLIFYAICGLGVIANVGIATVVFVSDYTWWLAGAAGALIGTVWNYAASAAFAWDR